MTHHHDPTLNEAHDARRLHRLFLAIIVVGALHMGEQLLFGIEEYHMLRGAVGRWHALFPPAWVDHASVVLITLVGTGLSLVLYVLVSRPAAARWVVGAFGVLGVTEVHHALEALAGGAYDPGLVTSLAYVGLGAWILLELWQRRSVPVLAPQAVLS